MPKTRGQIEVNLVGPIYTKVTVGESKKKTFVRPVCNILFIY